MKKQKIITALLVTSLVTGALTGCGSDSKSASSKDGVRTVKIACIQNGYPYSYVDDDGNVTGYDPEVMKLVDEKLTDYEFEFVPTSQEDALTGTEQGKYQVAMTNSFYTEERAKKYLIPETNIGASIGVLFFRKGEGPYTSWEDVATKKASLVPIKAGDGWQYLVDTYNKEHPDNQINLELTDSEDWLAGFGFVAEGRYDVFGMIKTAWTENVEPEDGDYHDLKDKLDYREFTSVKTFTMVSKKEEDLAEKIDTALKEIHESGKSEEISQKFYGENVLKYLDEFK